MWPLHARSKEEYVRLIQGYLDREEKAPLGDALGQALEDHGDDEGFCAWCAGVAHMSEVDGADVVVARFMEQFPMSLHPIQVDWAERRVWQGAIDDGTNEARAYLNRVRYRTDIPTAMEENDNVRDGCCRALLLLTAAYTELGARSYSRRVLGYALVCQNDLYWQRRFRAEYARIDQELAEPRNTAVDRVWEEFFRDGRNARDLASYCETKGYPILSRRVATLAEMFAETPGFTVDDAEMLHLLYRTEKGVFVLA